MRSLDEIPFDERWALDRLEEMEILMEKLEQENELLAVRLSKAIKSRDDWRAKCLSRT